MRVPMPERFIQSKLHRALRGVWFSLDWDTVINGVFAVASIVATTLLTILTLSDRQKPIGWTVLGILLVLVGVKVVAAVRKGDSEERLRRNVLTGCMHLLQTKVFYASDKFRFTLFVLDPLVKARVASADGQKRAEEVIVPYLRVQSGFAGASDFDSRTYYPRSSKSVTALAWRKAADAKDSLKTGEFTGFIYRIDQRFKSRAEMDQHYLDVLKIERCILKRIGDYMVDVVQIFSFPLVDNDGNFLALLSIDSKEYFSTGGGAVAGAQQPLAVDADRLRGYLNGVRAMLMRVGLRH